MAALLIIGGVADAVNVEAAMFAVSGMTLLMGIISVAMRREIRSETDPASPEP